MKRADCENGPRPCPRLLCRYHLGNLVLTGAERVPKGWVCVGTKIEDKAVVRLVVVEDMDQLNSTCALDVAEDGGATLEEVASYWGMTRERVRQIQNIALRRAKLRGSACLKEFSNQEPISKKSYPNE